MRGEGYRNEGGAVDGARADGHRRPRGVVGGLRRLLERQVDPGSVASIDKASASRSESIARAAGAPPPARSIRHVPPATRRTRSARFRRPLDIDAPLRKMSGLMFAERRKR